MTKTLKRRILAIPGDDGWWKRPDETLKVVDEMLEHGTVGEDAIVRWIETIYWDTANCFGG